MITFDEWWAMQFLPKEHKYAAEQAWNNCHREMEQLANSRVEETIRNQQAKIEAYKNTVMLKDVEIERLKLDILDAWIDENGTTWFRPTSWAYAQVCRVKNEQQSTIDRLLSSLKLNVPNCEAAFCNAKATYEYHDYEGTFCKCEKHKGSLYEINDDWNDAVKLIAEIEAKND